MRTVSLTEEESTAIAPSLISEETALWLHERFSKQIGVEFPSPINGDSYQLRPGGWVGVLDARGELELRIEPKTSVRNLFGMLDYAYDLASFRVFEGEAELDSVEDLFETLALRLASMTLDRAAKGLHREYLERDEELPLVRGRVDFARSLRRFARGSTDLQCIFDEQTADIDENRILAWTLYQLRRYPFRHAAIRQKVGRAYRAISSDVGLAPYRPEDCLDRFYDRMTQDYRLLHSICRFFLEHQGAQGSAGEADFVPFLLSMPTLFEAFVARWLEAHLPAHVEVQPQATVRLDDSGRYEFYIDLLLTEASSGRTLAVLDTKYKRHDRMRPSDIAQIIAYATSKDAELGFLVYPTPVDEGARLAAGPVGVRPLVFDLSKDLDVAGAAFLDQLLTELDSSMEDPLWTAYRRTRFEAETPQGRLTIRVDHCTPELDSLLGDLGLSTWCYITAWNPGVERPGREANRRRNRQLQEEIRARGWSLFHGCGIGEDPAWEPEESFLVVGISEADAVALGRRHGQFAIVVGEASGEARLVDCRPSLERAAD